MRGLLSGCFILAATNAAFAQFGDIKDLKVAKPEDKVHVKSVPPPRDDTPT